MLELYRRLRQRREELNMSQDELARKLGYKSRSSINKIEKGINDIPQAKIVEFAHALDTTPEYLMGWTDEKQNERDKFSREAMKLASDYDRLNNEGRSVLRHMLDSLIVTNARRDRVLQV